MSKKDRNSMGKDEEGKTLWEKVTRSIKAYSPAEKPARPSPARGKTTPKNAPAVAAPRDAPLSKGFDLSTETKLRRGKLPLEGRIDLHGLSQNRAFDALRRFILSSIAEEKRTVLVITGKGERSEGVLKRMLPLWLEDPEFKNHILAVTPAAPKDGGSGAFYVRFRKRR